MMVMILIIISDRKKWKIIGMRNWPNRRSST